MVKVLPAISGFAYQVRDNANPAAPAPPPRHQTVKTRHHRVESQGRSGAFSFPARNAAFLDPTAIATAGTLGLGLPPPADTISLTFAAYVILAALRKLYRLGRILTLGQS